MLVHSLTSIPLPPSAVIPRKTFRYSPFQYKIQISSDIFFSIIQSSVKHRQRSAFLAVPRCRAIVTRMSSRSLSIEGDSLQIAVHSLSIGTSGASTDVEVFEHFPDLPLELRLKIWRTTFVPRTVEVELAWNSFEQETLINLTENPTTLWVNRESRSETLQHYSLLFAKISQSPLYFCFDIDSLLVDAPSSSNLFTRSVHFGMARLSDTKGASAIQSLTFAKASWDDTISTIFQESLGDYHAKILENRQFYQELKRSSPQELEKPIHAEGHQREYEEDLPENVFAFHDLKEIVFYIGDSDSEKSRPNELESPQGRHKCKEDWTQFFRCMQQLFPRCKIPKIEFRQTDGTEMTARPLPIDTDL